MANARRGCLDGDARRTQLVEEARRWLDGIERQLEGRDWIASPEFSVADILLVTVLREIRRTDLLAAYPRLQTYYSRALERPAWKRTLAAYGKRLGVTVAELD